MEIIIMFVNNNHMNVNIINLFQNYKIKFSQIGIQFAVKILNLLNQKFSIEIIKPKIKRII